jgi:hypothetical protein
MKEVRHRSLFLGCLLAVILEACMYSRGSRLQNQLRISETVVKQSTEMFAKWCHLWGTGIKGKYWLTTSHRKMVEVRKLSSGSGRSWAEPLQKQHYIQTYVSAQEIYWTWHGTISEIPWRKRKYWATFFYLLIVSWWKSFQEYKMHQKPLKEKFPFYEDVSLVRYKRQTYRLF